MRNISFVNDFDLHENEPADGTHFQTNGFALRLVSETEAQNNSEMAYSLTDLLHFGNI